MTTRPFTKPLNTTSKDLLTEGLSVYLDINVDLGQARDQTFFESNDYELLNYVSSVNLPCCVHEGHPVQVEKLAARAKAAECAVGAHIAYPDPKNAGYSHIDLDEDELAAWIRVQLGTLTALIQPSRAELTHVRPHGALYDAILTKPEVAKVMAETMMAFNPWLVLVGPAGESLERLKAETNVRTAPEVVLGRRYKSGLIPLTGLKDSDLEKQATLEQAQQLLKNKNLTTQDGKTQAVEYHTFHLRPGLPDVIEVAKTLNQWIHHPVPLPVVAMGPSGWV